jgi:hypothetical protein
MAARGVRATTLSIGGDSREIEQWRGSAWLGQALGFRILTFKVCASCAVESLAHSCSSHSL